jgi:hypothetical protein
VPYESRAGRIHVGSDEIKADRAEQSMGGESAIDEQDLSAVIM